MKFLVLLTSLALAMSSVKAVECTPELVSVVQTTPEFQTYLLACDSFIASTGSNVNAAAVKKLCNDVTCLNAYEAVMKTVPDCTYQGASFKDSFDMVMTRFKSICKDAGTSSSASTVFTTPTIVVVAVAVVVGQFY